MGTDILIAEMNSTVPFTPAEIESVRAAFQSAVGDSGEVTVAQEEYEDVEWPSRKPLAVPMLAVRVSATRGDAVLTASHGVLRHHLARLTESAKGFALIVKNCGI